MCLVDDGGKTKMAAQIPGPGAYDGKSNRYKNSPQWGLGSSQRSEMQNLSVRAVPGPNQYDLKTKIGEGPKFFMGTKTDDG